MTDPIRISKKRRADPAQAALFFGGLLLLLLFLLRSEEAARHVSSGLSLCVRRVIPTLFPFMVVSSLLLSSDCFFALSRRLAPPFQTLFGVSGQGGCAVLLGLFCGFPVAAQCASSLYEEGRIGRGEFCRLMTFANNPSAAFLIGSVGGSLFGDPSFGVLLYALTILSASLIGIIGNLLFGKKEENIIPLSIPPVHKKSGAACFTDAVVSSASAMLSICGFVVFFTALTGILSDAILPQSLSDELRALLLGCFELTGGTELAAACAPPLGCILCAFLVGFSGFSVHFQLMSLCARHSFFFRSYLLAKLCHGLLNALLMGVALALR